MVTEGEAFPLNPSPIWIVVGGAEQRLAYLLLVVASQEKFYFFAISFHHHLVSHVHEPHNKSNCRLFM
jgi:hypothetical protein